MLTHVRRRPMRSEPPVGCRDGYGYVMQCGTPETKLEALDALFAARETLFDATVYYEAMSFQRAGDKGRKAIANGLAALGVDLPADAFQYRTEVKDALAFAKQHVDSQQFRFGPGHVHNSRKQQALHTVAPAARTIGMHADLVRRLCPSVVARYEQPGPPPYFELHRRTPIR